MKPFLDLITFQAFRPDALDVTVPLVERMKGKRLIALSGLVGASVAVTEMRLVAIDVAVDGTVKIGDPEYFAAKNIEAQVQNLVNYADRMDTKYVAVLMQDAFTVSLTEKSQQMTDVETLTMCRTNPGRVLGIQREPERVYSLVRHPKLKTGLVFSLPKKRISEVVDLVTKSSLDLVRLQCGVASIVSSLIHSDPAVVIGESDLLIVDGLQVFHLFVDKGDWVKVPLNLPPNPNAEFLGALRAYLARALPPRQHMKLSVVNSGKADLSAFFAQTYPNVAVTHLFRDEPHMREATQTTGSVPVSVVDFESLMSN